MGKSKNFLLLFALLCLGSLAAFGQKRTVSGTVRDSAGAALPGISVTLKGTRTGAVTDANGHYQVQASAKDVLVFSGVGYAAQEVKAGSPDLSVALGAAHAELGEVVVTSLGIKKQARALGYAVSTVSAKDITESGSTNFASALYGKAAGVKISTAPGGASSAVSVQIRGVSSIGLNTQPLYVVDGVPIRLYNDLSGNSGNGSNNNGYWSDQRIEANGVLDINPDDIESITILKGASASALYGSEATNGVMVITTKKGSKSRGLGVDFNYTATMEKLAYQPDYQNEYGPGYDAQTNVANGIADATGWATADTFHHPYWRSYAEFGPKFDGSTVRYWDGTFRKYVAHPNNFKDFFSTGYNSTANAAISGAGDNGNFRLSYTRFDYKSIMPGTNLNKNNFNFNGTLKLNNRVSVDLVSTYNNTFTHNRTYQMGQIFGSYGGFFSRADDMSAYFDHYQTTDGYKYVLPSNNSYDQNQKLAYNIRATNLLDYLWTQLRDSYNESQNRFINSLTLNVGLTDDLKIRGRVGGDFTSLGIEEKDHNTQPASLGYTGYYGVTSNTFNIFYGDGLITYSPKINNDLSLSASAGYTARKMVYHYQNTGTTNGLQDEDFFSISNSAGAVSSNAYRQEQVDVAGFGILDLNYKSFLYLEGTGRYESSSTLPAANNSYLYPSFNGGFILSDVVKLPTFFNYAKLRGSWGLVGNHPGIYQANVAYNQSALTYNNTNLLFQASNSSGFGNNSITSEQKREAEFGLETRMLNDRIGLDVSYYNNKVNHQILTLSTATSVGASSVLANAGNLSNYGIEAAITGQIINRRDFRWTSRFNFAINKNKLVALPNGLSTLDFSSQDGGYLIIRGKVGDPLGNIYVHPKATDAKGNAVIDDYGFYTVNTNAYQYAGNIMPKVVGGFSNSFSYKEFSLDFTLDYRFGGKMVSIPTYYQIGSGMYKNTLQYRDAAHGGIPYVVNSDANADYTASSAGTRTDGVILPGVTSSGATNTKVITAAMYYENAYNWETAGLYQNAVFDNSYIKFREVTLSYNLPKAITSKIHFQGLQLSLIGRNLFYLYKTLPHGIDPEATVGSSWLSQGLDGGAAAPTRSMGVSLKARF
ncbi:SusC/RagA family TonB-linked outer membrane protein [Dinghuibacter silviterrae]|uniref:Iron complex outermembrane receptor protein n=1 Tax=Dinghuibacter silviterrae TaxID=1539049 RepID=A0A4R8DMX1_9BACT|nr:SusC/RagA family TonB-linked outer membrane protein [Dinghuibacter silviterrae]TDW99128.1 iron complex outermembrane receptor protein [Dinghuibacter silviterrae]